MGIKFKDLSSEVSRISMLFSDPSFRGQPLFQLMTNGNSILPSILSLCMGNGMGFRAGVAANIHHIEE